MSVLDLGLTMGSTKDSEQVPHARDELDIVSASSLALGSRLTFTESGLLFGRATYIRGQALSRI